MCFETEPTFAPLVALVVKRSIILIGIEFKYLLIIIWNAIRTENIEYLLKFNDSFKSFESFNSFDSLHNKPKILCHFTRIRYTFPSKTFDNNFLFLKSTH